MKVQQFETSTEGTYYPGTRVKVFDSRLCKDDVSTPIEVTIKSATVVSWYGKKSQRFGIYPSLIDVQFDHDLRVSKGHFANPIYVEILST